MAFADKIFRGLGLHSEVYEKRPMTTEGSKFPLYRSLRYRMPALNLALASLIFALLIPTDPLIGGGDHVDPLDRADAATIKIYSFVSRKGSFSEGLAWSIAEAILKESKRHSLDPLLILAVIEVESRFRPGAVSPGGARGLMQIRPFVATALAETADIEAWKGKESLDDPILNIKLGVFYLSQLKESFKDLKLALTAYNLGPAQVKNRLEERVPMSFTYAKKVLSVHRIYRSQNTSKQMALLADRESQRSSL